jgi:xanthine/uracil/vitamin C permease (AzgA family)
LEALVDPDRTRSGWTVVALLAFVVAAKGRTGRFCAVAGVCAVLLGLLVVLVALVPGAALTVGGLGTAGAGLATFRRR